MTTIWAFAGNSGSGLGMGRSNDVTLAPTEASVVVTTNGATRSFDCDTYVFVGGCK